jgi:hypothetical protein
MSESYPIASWAAAFKGDLKHAGFTSADIEKSEALGQEEVVNSTKLPIEGDWKELIELGFVRGKNIDDLFCEAALPTGWQKVASGHSMWSYIEDHRGLTRASIFYKAAFYDRSATITVKKNRFYTSPYHEMCDKNGVQCVVMDAGRDIAVMIFDPVYFATLDGILGAVHKGLFYSKIKGPKYDEYFDEKKVDGTRAVIMRKDEFYKNCHHVNPRHDLLKAVDKLADQEAIEFINSIQKELQWTAQFDFQPLQESNR